MCVFNNYTVARESIESIINNTDVPYKLILVNNYSFDLQTQEYLKEISSKYENVIVVDPGKNLGCPWGWNFGFKYRAEGFPYCAKVDDDTIVSKNWASQMISAFKNWWRNKQRVIGILGANIDCRTDSLGKIQELDGFKYETPKDIVSFSCVMFYTDVVIHKFGPLRGMNYHTALGLKILSDEGENLYGGDETYYFNLSTQCQYDNFYLHNVLVHHIDCSKRDWSFLVWKFAYGYLGLMRQDYFTFIRDAALYQKAWLFLIKSRESNIQCSWYGKDLNEVVSAFKEECLKRGWDAEKLLQKV